MAIHFLQSARAKTLSIGAVMKMTDGQVDVAFRKVRWPETDGTPVCPNCGGEAWEARRKWGASRFRCRACRCDFSLTSGTVFAHHKASLRVYLVAICICVNEVKGKNALALSRDLGMSHKACWCLLHKIREALAADFRGRTLGGDGKVVEVDAAFVGGYVQQTNLTADRIDRRLAQNQTGKRKAVIIIRERNGKSVPAVFKSEGAAVAWIKSRIKSGTVVHADQSGAWDDLHSRFEMMRVNHQEGYSVDGSCTNLAESFFSRLRRGELGHYHHISGPYTLRYAQEAGFKEDCRRVSNGEQVHRIMGLAMKAPPSPDFCGYYQRHLAA